MYYTSTSFHPHMKSHVATSDTLFSKQVLRCEGEQKYQTHFGGSDTAFENTVRETDCDHVFELSFISDIKVSLIKSTESLKRSSQLQICCVLLWKSTVS